MAPVGLCLRGVGAFGPREGQCQVSPGWQGLGRAVRAVSAQRPAPETSPRPPSQPGSLKPEGQEATGRAWQAQHARGGHRAAGRLPAPFLQSVFGVFSFCELGVGGGRDNLFLKKVGDVKFGPLAVPCRKGPTEGPLGQWSPGLPVERECRDWPVPCSGGAPGGGQPLRPAPSSS